MRTVTRNPDSTSTSTSTSLGSDAARSAASSDRLERRSGIDAGDGDASATAGEEATDGPIELAAAADQCRTCGATIGPRERRLSWVVETATATLEAHYCSETCLPDEPPTGASSSTAEADAQQAPRDWSYCR